MMQRKRLILCGIFLCLTMSNAVHAEQKGSPLLLFITGKNGSYGNLWAWDGQNRSLRQLTTGDHDLSPVMSPDGNYVAYDSVPEIAIPPERSGWPPMDIGVLDVATGEAIRVAGQPPGANYADDSRPLLWVERPKPAWSPDSQSLAWGEHVVPKMTIAGRSLYRLVSYDLVQRRQRVVVANLPGDQQITHGQPVDWSERGIADAAIGGAQDASPVTLYVYTAAGKLLFTKAFQTEPRPVGDTLARWVSTGTKTVVYMCDDTHQYLLDPISRKQSETTGQLEIYSALAPGGLSLFLTLDDSGFVSWHIAAKGQAIKDLDVKKTRLHIYGNTFDTVTIAPNGQQIAYLADKGVFIYDATGETTPVEPGLTEDQEITWIGWGPTALRLRQP
jgi:dipeptidyl aminopeptidase/acylaminoacyl peptidase